MILHARRAALLVDLDPPDHGEVTYFRPRCQRPRKPHHERTLLGVGRAADAAEAPIDAGRRQAARGGHGGKRRRYPLHAQLLAAARQHEAGGVHLVRAVRIAPALRSPRIGDRPCDLQRLLDLAVVTPHLAPIDRPIDAVAEGRAGLEPLGTEAQRDHHEVNAASAHRLAAVAPAQLERTLGDDAFVQPIELHLLDLIGGELIERTEPGAGVERHHGEAAFGELRGECRAAETGADDGEIDLLVLPIFLHRNPGAWAHDVGGAAVLAAWAFGDDLRHGACSPIYARPHPTDRSDRNPSGRTLAARQGRRSRSRPSLAGFRSTSSECHAGRAS